jgi:hypothetical protein
MMGSVMLEILTDNMSRSDLLLSLHVAYTPLIDWPPTLDDAEVMLNATRRWIHQIDIASAQTVSKLARRWATKKFDDFTWSHASYTNICYSRLTYYKPVSWSIEMLKFLWLYEKNLDRVTHINNVMIKVIMALSGSIFGSNVNCRLVSDDEPQSQPNNCLSR